MITEVLLIMSVNALNVFDLWIQLRIQGFSALSLAPPMSFSQGVVALRDHAHSGPHVIHLQPSPRWFRPVLFALLSVGHHKSCSRVKNLFVKDCILIVILILVEVFHRHILADVLFIVVLHNAQTWGGPLMVSSLATVTILLHEPISQDLLWEDTWSTLSTSSPV